MWFYGKSEEEIRQRLLKEGIWYKWLEDAKRDDEERIAQAEQEILNTEEGDELLASATNHLLSLLKNVKTIKYKSIRAYRNDVGDVILHLLQQARKSIRVTHFFREQYSKMYLGVQLEKAHQGVPLERIVYFHEGATDDYKWLDQFRDEKGELIDNYKEYEIKTNRLFPFDLMIIDEKYAILVYRRFPADEVMIFENDFMVQCIMDIWRNLRPQQDRRGRYKVWRTRSTPNQRRKKM